MVIYVLKRLTGALLLVGMLILPFFLEWTIWNAYFKVLGIVMWTLIILTAIIWLILPEKYGDKIVAYIEWAAERLLEGLH